MANHRITFYLEAHCQNHPKKQFTCLFYSEDQEGSWYLHSGSKRSRYIENLQSPKDVPIRLFSRLKVNPHFSCPFCRNRSLYRCQSCHHYSCWDGVTVYVRCANPTCLHEGKIVIPKVSQGGVTS